ncbi:MAG: Hpt domain-containing protein [Myxococcota bacterium]
MVKKTSPAESALAPSVQSPFDRVGLLHRLGGSTEVLAEVAALFCSDARRLHRELRGHIERHDTRSAVTSAHQLKGALLNLSAEPAASTARVLEASARAGDWAMALVHADQLGAELEPLLAALAREQTAA